MSQKEYVIVIRKYGKIVKDYVLLKDPTEKRYGFWNVFQIKSTTRDIKNTTHLRTKRFLTPNEKI